MLLFLLLRRDGSMSSQAEPLAVEIAWVTEVANLVASPEEKGAAELVRWEEASLCWIRVPAANLPQLKQGRPRPVRTSQRY